MSADREKEVVAVVFIMAANTDHPYDKAALFTGPAYEITTQIDGWMSRPRDKHGMAYVQIKSITFKS